MASFIIMLILLILSVLFIMTFCIGMFVIPRVSSLSKELHLYDLPDSRKIHKMPIPRTGGVVFLPAVAISIAFVLVVLLRTRLYADDIWRGSIVGHFLAYLSGGMILFSVGLYDDIHGVGYKAKFIAQIIAASLLCVSGLWVATFGDIFFIGKIPFWIGMPVTIASVVYLTNAINLIDGIDGLASGLACISLAVLAAVNLINHYLVWAMLCTAFLGVVMAFFYYNVFNKSNKIFMGDTGSLTLGFTLSFLVLHFWQKEPVWNPHLHNIGIIAVSTLVIPLFDVVRVMMSRIRDHRNPFLPDKNHIHHKLLRAGLSGSMTMVTILLLSCLFILTNYFVASYISPSVIVVMDVVLFCLMHIVINIFIARKESETGIKWNRVM